MPRVEATNERMIFKVQSFTNASRFYRVDLLALNGAGQCACTDWSMRRAGAIAEGRAIGTRATMCRHVNEARRFFLNDLLQVMAKGEES